MEFTTVRKVVANRAKNYAPYIRVLFHFGHMVMGFPTVELGMPSVDELVILRKYMELEVNGVSTGEPYVDSLFHHFAASVESIDININLHSLSIAFTDAGGRSYYGFKHWRSMWFEDIDDDESLDICIFLRVFKNLKILTVSRWWQYGWMNAIAVDGRFMESIISAIELMNDEDIPSADLEELFLINPDLSKANYDNLQEMVIDYNPMFEAFGWEIKQHTFYRRGISHLGCDKCETSLCISQKQ